MKKLILFAASAVAVLASCTQNEEFNSQVANNETPVTFGTYMGQGTRAGSTDPIVDDAALQKVGFGVFGYHTGASKYASSTTPNFMYNQKVEYTSGEWGYSPIKYWPNDYTTADKQNPAAQGTLANNYVSFFAYAPYVANVSAKEGTVNNTDNAAGITAMSTNGLAGNPYIQYTLSTNGNDVDLLWGTAGGSGKYINDADASNTNEGINSKVLKTSSTTDYVKVNGDLQKMTTTGKIKFSFKHALAKVGGPDDPKTTGKVEGLAIVLDPDEYENTQTTKVTVKSIEIVTSASTTTGTGDAAVTTYYKGGQFDLKTGEWTYPESMKSTTAIGNTSKIVTTPATDSNEQKLKEDIAEPATLADGTDAWDGLVEGVTKTAKAVYNDNTAKPVLFIPGTVPSLQVKIDYIVRTKDAQLAKGYSEVEQIITRTVDFQNGVELNKMYNLLIKLGLTSVKFEATVESWEKAGDVDGDGDIDADDDAVVNLPLNVTE